MEEINVSSQESTQQLRDTQDLQDFGNEPEQEQNFGTVWGRLFAIQEPFISYNLTKKIYTFGRGDVDHQFNSSNFDRLLLPYISNVHFKIMLEEKQDGESLVILEDLSLNGMFVNGKPTKGLKTVLQNNFEISFANPTKKLYVFYDCLKNDAEDYPKELTQTYTISKRLGEGSFGEVRLAYRQGTLERCAIKILKKKGTCMALNNLKQITNEIHLLKSVDHPCIIKFLDAIETPEKMFIVMEAAGGGELFDRLVSRGCLPEPAVKFFFYQLLLAVQYLHQRKITHRDIKPENILLATTDEFTTIKLTDFGLSKLAADASQMTTFCGTFIYIAPELLDTATATYTSQVDMWSLGVVLYVSFVGASPFHGNDLEVRQSILQAKYSFGHKLWKAVSEPARDLIMRLLVRDPKLRLDAAAALKHHWLEDDKMKQQVERLLQTNMPSFTPPSRKRPLQEEEETLLAPMDKTPRLPNGLAGDLLQGR
uniref:Serine/threonine-protein kinase Chk2 n=1 Tax=Scylla olivacea TaxID=85551 RepID=A0A0P4VZK1_SCYOL